MRKRSSIPYGKGKRMFKRTSGIHKANLRGAPMRGGIRL